MKKPFKVEFESEDYNEIKRLHTHYLQFKTLQISGIIGISKVGGLLNLSRFTIHCNQEELEHYFMSGICIYPRVIHLKAAVYTNGRIGSGDILIVDLKENHLTMADLEPADNLIIEYGGDSFTLTGIECSATPGGHVFDLVGLKVRKQIAR